MKAKLVWVSIGSMLAVLALVAATVERQMLSLAEQERAQVQSMYAGSKESELKQYVELARAAIWKLAASDGDQARLQRQALAILSQMRFGSNGYFFVYDRYGNILLDPGQMGMEGVEFCEPGNPLGQQQASLLLKTGHLGGGVVHYDWQKPASQDLVPKMSYVMPIEPWGWIMGAGLYLDEIEAVLNQIDQDVRQNIEETRRKIFWIAAASIFLIGMAGLAMNVTDHRLSSEKLQRLAQRVVRSQEDERVRVARDLHDGVVQVMVSSKFLLEAAQTRLQSSASADAPAAVPSRSPGSLLEQGLVRLNEALGEIRRVSHGLRPALLDDLGLDAALGLLVEQSRGHCPFELALRLLGKPAALPATLGTALFRVAQEALTNAQLHSGARRVEITLAYERARVRLQVADDGAGFDLARVQADANGGIGLRNMRERVESLGGAFRMSSGPKGTVIEAVLPLGGSAGTWHDA